MKEFFEKVKFEKKKKSVENNKHLRNVNFEKNQQKIKEKMKKYSKCQACKSKKLKICW